MIDPQVEILEKEEKKTSETKKKISHTQNRNCVQITVCVVYKNVKKFF